MKPSSIQNVLKLGKNIHLIPNADPVDIGTEAKMKVSVYHENTDLDTFSKKNVNDVLTAKTMSIFSGFLHVLCIIFRKYQLSPNLVLLVKIHPFSIHLVFNPLYFVALFRNNESQINTMCHISDQFHVTISSYFAMSP